MKILLTGSPGIGKSTILEKIRRNYSGAEFGILSKELKDKSKKRVGFEAINHLGRKKTFAHTTDIASRYVVGEKYFVDINVIEKFVVSELEKGIDKPGSLVFIDEIGRMQAFSDKFLNVVRKLLNIDSNVIATIVFDPEPWSVEFKENKNVLLIRVSEKNRDLLPNLLEIMFSCSNTFHQLARTQQDQVLDLSRKYFEEGKFIQISKLFKNAIPYLVHNRVKKIDVNKFEIIGNTNTHIVEKLKTGYICDCDLFNGREEYANNNGECSHIQTVKLLEIK